MRRIILIATASICTMAIKAQTVQDGIKMYNYHKYQSAEKILAPLADKDPIANYYLGLSYLDDGNPTQANLVFAKYPEDFANISGTARVAFVTKNPSKGMEIAKNLAAKARKKEWIPEKYAADAIAYTEGGDNQQAINWYKDVLTKTDDADVHIGLGDTYKKSPTGGGDAMNNYEHVTDKDPKNSLVLTRIGDLWYISRVYPSAVDNYAKAKEADPQNPLPYKALADAYTVSGKYTSALENLRKYYELSDKTIADKIKLLEGLYRAQSSCEAVKLAQEIQSTQQQLLTADQKTEVTGILGYSQSDCGDSLGALKNLRVYFATQNPTRIKPADYLEYGKLFLKLGMLDSAGYYYTKGIAGDTSRNKTDVYRQIAEAFKSKKDYCKSAEWYTNLVKANPETQPLDYAWRGIMYYYCNDMDKAAAAFKEYGVKYPDQPYAFYWQGRVAAAIDSEAKSGAAVEPFKKWLDMPGDKKANDQKGAYEYLMYYYYHQKDKENMKLYMDKIRAIDPNNTAVKEIEEAEKASAAPRKTAPAKGKK